MRPSCVPARSSTLIAQSACRRTPTPGSSMRWTCRRNGIPPWWSWRAGPSVSAESHNVRIERLGENHDRSSFRSGDESLDRWFSDHAWTAQRQDTARTFVLITDDDEIVGYYSLAMGSVERASAP